MTAEEIRGKHPNEETHLLIVNYCSNFLYGPEQASIIYELLWRMLDAYAAQQKPCSCLEEVEIATSGNRNRCSNCGGEIKPELTDEEIADKARRIYGGFRSGITALRAFSNGAQWARDRQAPKVDLDGFANYCYKVGLEDSEHSGRKIAPTYQNYLTQKNKEV